MPSHVATAAGLVAMTLLCAACGASQRPVSEPTSQVPRVHRLYPLAEGHAWAYDVDTGDGHSVLATTRVVASDGERITVRTGADEHRVYELRPEGIYRPASQTWLLRAPLDAGASWPSTAGATARVAQAGIAIDTPAGRFEDCVEVLESGGAAGLEVRTAYCPDVGPVRVDSRMHAELTGKDAAVVAVLRGYQVDTR